MVMAAGSVCQQFAADELSHEVGEAGTEAAALHERLVAYVHALAGGHDVRSGVWVEHSYARSRGVAHAPAAHVRVLLAPRHDTEPDVVDVERAEPSPPDLPAPREPPAPPERDDSDEDDEWEARVAALAPSAVHARLAGQALDTLRRMRLARLAAVHGYARLEAARSAARRLRLALAAASVLPAPHQQRPGAWLHATLHAYMPRAVRRLYDELAGELRRTAPRVAARTMGGTAPPPRVDPLAAVGAPVSAEGSPWLVWVGCGRERLDERWRRRLGALLHTRVLPAASAAPASPEAWCAAVAGSVRAALADTLAEAGERPVFLGGVGAGAALVTALAASASCAARLRGLLLLAPPLLTAEGPRDSPDDPLAEVRLPMLLVAGTGAAGSWRLAARGAVRARGELPARRLLELRGADDALRLPAALRRRRRLPQHALDAAVAEECARWAIETAESPGSDSPVRERPRRREPRAAGVVLRSERVFASADADEEEYAHLPTAAARPAPPDGPDRAIEVVAEFTGRRGVNSSLDVPKSLLAAEGRVVSRGSGGTPLALLPPRRRSPAPAAPPRRRSPAPAAPPRRRSPAPAAPPRRRSPAPAAPPRRRSPAPAAPPRRRSPAPAAPPRRRSPAPSAPPPRSSPAPAAPPLGAADIMRLPIVFADDEPAGEAVTVTSGVPRGRDAARYTRVIVASRGARGPVLLRRGVRLLPRADTSH